MWDCLDCPSSPSFIPSFFTSDSRKRRLVLSLLSAEDPDTGSDTRHTSRTLLHTTTENNEVKGGGKKLCPLTQEEEEWNTNGALDQALFYFPYLVERGGLRVGDARRMKSEQAQVRNTRVANA